MYTGTKFKPVGSANSSASQPTDAVLGDEWFDTTNNQYYIYSGSAWTLIGPTTVAGSGVTQVIPESPEDNTGVKRRTVIRPSFMGYVMVKKTITNKDSVFKL